MMISKDYMINTLHALYRKDKWIRELFNSVGLTLDRVNEALDEVYGNNYFDTATLAALERFEKEAKIIPGASQSIESRRSTVRAKWIGTSKADIVLLQEVADSWKNGLIKLSFVDGKIKAVFTSPIGVPEDIDILKNILETVKPAHLAIWYVYLYLTWRNALAYGTWGDHHTDHTWLDLYQSDSFREYVLEFTLEVDNGLLYQVVENVEDAPPVIDIDSETTNMYATFADIYDDTDISFVVSNGKIYMEYEETA